MKQHAAERHIPLPPGTLGGGQPLAPTQLLTAREAARTLAVSERTLWSMTRRGDVRPVRFGRAVRYDAADLVALVERAKGRAGGQ